MVAQLEIRKTFQFGRFAGLLASLVALFAISPFFNDHAEGASVASMLFSAVMVASIYAVSGERSWLWIGIILVIPSLVLEYLARLNPIPVFVMGNLALTGIFIVFVATIIMIEILRDEYVSTDTIFGGICIYLLIGFLWVMGYAFIEYLHPGAFLLHGETLRSYHPQMQIRFPELMYFSFVTMTTLGYGDMVPVAPAARTLASAEAVTGQLYVAIFVARLVGLHLAHTPLRRSND